MKKLEEEAKRFMQSRIKPTHELPDIIKNLETILRRLKEIDAKNNTNS